MTNQRRNGGYVMTNGDPNAVFTYEQTMEYMHMSRDKIRELILVEGLPAVKFGRLWRFPKKSIDEWLTNRAITAAAERSKENRRK